MRKLYTILAISIIFLGGCAEENDLILDNQGVNRWLHSVMKEKYLWSSQMSKMSAENLNMHPVTYFNNCIRYRADKTKDYRVDTYGDRFSKIQELSLSTRGAEYGSYESFAVKNKVNDFGLGIRTYESSNGSNVNFIQVIYVVPQSPAYFAGIKRGDRINVINGVRMPANKGEVVYELQQQKINISIYHPQPSRNDVALVREDYYDNPIIFDTIYNTTPKTAYVVYNHFSTGESDRFLYGLNSVFRKFREAGARNLILDMRYNGGGELTVARHLASLIARRDMLGQPLIYKESVGSHGNKDMFSIEDFAVEKSDIGANNMNAENLRIICTKNTASASELIMHAMKPYYGANMKIIGEKTVGKNVGSAEVTNKRYLWKLNPITIRVYNRDKVSGYEMGIYADVQAIEATYNNPEIGDFGDTEKETLVVAALNSLFPGRYALPVRDSYRTEKSSTGVISTQVPDRGLVTERIVVE